MHGSVVNAQVKRIAGLLSTSTGHYGTYRNNIDNLLTQMSIIWGAHASAVNSQVNRISGFLGTSTGHYGTYRGNVTAILSQLSAAWNAHASAGASAAARLASAVASNFGRIRSEASATIASLNRLQDTIDSLRSKTITVTTVRRTVTRSRGVSATASGRRGAQHGYAGVISQPTWFTVGEGNRPEFVFVQPLRSTAAPEMVSIFYSIWSTYTAADKKPRSHSWRDWNLLLMLGFILLIIEAEVDKRKDPAFTARREKRWKSKQNARRKGKRV